eukprot:COSAG02_NODE_811_length_16911_cov_343.583095_4_plen_95_part_00
MSAHDALHRCRARASVGYVLRPLDGPDIFLRIRPAAQKLSDRGGRQDGTLLVQTVDKDGVRQDLSSAFGVFTESAIVEQEEELLAYLARATAAA